MTQISEVRMQRLLYRMLAPGPRVNLGVTYITSHTSWLAFISPHMFDTRSYLLVSIAYVIIHLGAFPSGDHTISV